MEKRHVQDAIRSLMRKMNIDVVELAENHEKTRFCGMNLVAPCNPSNAKLAPKRYVEEGGHMFQPIPPEEQAAYFQSYCAQFTTDRVVCYCKSCRGGLLKGGKRPCTFWNCCSLKNETAQAAWKAPKKPGNFPGFF